MRGGTKGGKGPGPFEKRKYALHSKAYIRSGPALRHVSPVSEGRGVPWRITKAHRRAAEIHELRALVYILAEIARPEPRKHPCNCRVCDWLAEDLAYSEVMGRVYVTPSKQKGRRALMLTNLHYHGFGGILPNRGK